MAPLRAFLLIVTMLVWSATHLLVIGTSKYVNNTEKTLSTEYDYSQHIVVGKTSKHKNSHLYTKFEMVTQKVASPTHSSHILRGQEQTRIAIKHRYVYVHFFISWLAKVCFTAFSSIHCMSAW